MSSPPHVVYILCFETAQQPSYHLANSQVPAAYLSSNVSDYRMETTATHLGYLQQLDVGRREFAARADDLQLLVQAQADSEPSVTTCHPNDTMSCIMDVQHQRMPLFARMSRF